MTLSYGLSEDIIAGLRGALAAQPRLERATLFGSRARGDFHPASDIDLAVYGGPDFTFRDYLDLTGRIDDLPIVFRVDVVDAKRLDKPSLLSEIAREGVSFWESGRD